MKTTYITFTQAMARAYREGRKKMTRRVARHRFDDDKIGICRHCEHGSDFTPCPYGQVGDRLIFGTTWAVPEMYDDMKPSELSPGYGFGANYTPIPIWSYFDGDEKPEGFGKLRPGRFLPNKLRHRMPYETLKTVRAERVQNIRDEEVLLEGVRCVTKDGNVMKYCVYDKGDYCSVPWCDMPRVPREAFKNLWDSINKNRGYGWDVNPLVWALRW